MSDKVEVENVNHPGQVTRLDAVKYHDVRRALLQVLPSQAPGLDWRGMMNGIRPLLSQELFPNGEKSGWWLKSVQLDLDAKGLVRRHPTKPLTFTRT